MEGKKREFVPAKLGKQTSLMEVRRNNNKEQDKQSIHEKLEELAPIRSAIQRMIDARSQPKINQLLSMAWQSNELHLLFADTGVGKSIFAVALSLSLCKAQSFLGLMNETSSQKVLYYDFELSDRQFRKRYSNEDGREDPLHENFYIDTIDFAKLSDIAGGFNDEFNNFVFEKIIYDIKTTRATVLVLDNLTFLHTQSTQDTKIALDTMRKLNELKKEFNLSILVLAHTPKRSMQSALTINDLAGSKHLSNFADSISAIGKSAMDSNLRYYKQVKPSRSGEMLYDGDNVVVIEIVKKNTLLTFDFLEFGNESDHLRESSYDEYLPNKLEAVAEYVKQGKSFREIAKEMDISIGTISKWKTKYPGYFEDVSVSPVSSVSLCQNKETRETQETAKQEILNFKHQGDYNQ